MRASDDVRRVLEQLERDGLLLLQDAAAIRPAGTIRVYIMLRSAPAASTQPGDPLYGDPRAASLVARIPRPGGGFRDFLRERVHLVEVPPGDLATGHGPRVPLVSDGPAPHLRVLTDQLGTIQAFTSGR